MAKQIKITSEEREALRYAGLLGHRFIITNANNVCLCEIDDKARAFEELAEGNRFNKLFRQFPKRKFARIK